ncbi:Very-long-chain (3R)-3-hydroxyacyl-CoA dehydratase 1 [Smittium culicis]|uniref:Very-long-chain (3R)-3-hydroxyacyl-CoA dehydratase n=1 Tax=Smittium culicis TaxID=133412 RepID=A0A1R1YU14_9FUNG|nr:Very-long-chain (3R)-3-hydroxyacyl-CoA dehydratase 1 [Smittium culicis]
MAKEKKLSPIVKNYLIAYNVVSAALWGYVLVASANHILSGKSHSNLFGVVGHKLISIQTLASLEIVHSILGFVSSGVITTMSQVYSRLMLVWGILYLLPFIGIFDQVGVPMLIFAWSITETIRYPFYVLAILDIKFYPLLWARYTFFYILYPLGVAGELLTIYRALPAAKLLNVNYYYFLIGMMALYPPAFYSLYTHMIKQRRKQLRSSSPPSSADSDSKDYAKKSKISKKAKRS